MLRRRQSGVPPRQGPSLLGTMARTAAISGTATATSRAVNNAMNQKAMQAQQEQINAQIASLQPPVPASGAAPAVQPGQPDLLAQLTQLAQLKETGVLSEAEFQLAKAKLLG